MFNMNNPYKKWMVVLFVLFHFTGSGEASCIGLDSLMQTTRSSCVVAHLTGECIDPDENDEFDEFLNLRNLSRTLSEDIGVFVGYIGISEKWADETPINNGVLDIGDVVLYRKMKKGKDFLDPSPQPTHLDPIVYKRKEGHKSLIDFVNIECEIYITENGSLSKQGVHREEILRERFHVKNISNVKFKDAFHSNCFTEGEFCEVNRNNIYQDEEKLPECEKLESLPSKDEFFHKFVKKSKPVIFKSILRDWPAFTKWSNAYLRETFGQKHIQFQMSPNGDYEGVEPLSLWENAIRDELMNADNLPFPDLVLVRPAPVNGTFSIFLDIIEGLSKGTLASFSAYFQYSSIPEYLPELEKDLREDLLFPGLFINREERNIWLSEGHTRGKLHFDAYENFLSQISGKKEVILFDPNNNHQLYEGHLQEATLILNWTTKSFHRRHVNNNTNAVMSPVNMVKPDFSRFPLFGDTYPLNCTLEEGDVLYLPSFWWHEVQSFPNVTARRNLAVNFWYEPFFSKDHPCPECPLDVNPKYRHLL